MLRAYYSENDPAKAAWLRELIARNLVAPGDVDERSIVDVRGADLAGYAQCHFFAGIAAWSYALRCAGWEDSRPVWTGSAPCPSFSAAGKGKGFDDPRHLWPEWFRLIRECRPATVIGEQVDAAIGHGWLDIVGMDLEEEGYAVAAAVLPAASVGAPHKRNRLYFCAVSEYAQRGTEHQKHRIAHGRNGPGRGSDTFCGANPDSGSRIKSERRSVEWEGIAGFDGGDCSCADTERDGGRPDEPQREEEGRTANGRRCTTGDVPHPDGRQPGDGDIQRSGQLGLFAQDRGTGERMHANRSRAIEWQDAGDDCETGRETASGARAENGSDLPYRAGDACNDSHPASGGLGVYGSAPGNGGHPAFADETGVVNEPIGAGLEGHFGNVREWRGPGWLDPHTARSVAEAGATRGFWGDCDWWYGRDGKYRPTGPGITPLIAGAAKSRLFALADGSATDVGLVRPGVGETDESLEEAEPQTGEARVMRLRGYGDAIVVPVAAEFIAAVMETLGELKR